MGKNKLLLSLLAFTVPVLANDAVWRLDNVKQMPEYCADVKKAQASVAQGLIPFGEIIYGMPEASGIGYDSWFVGNLDSENPAYESYAKAPDNSLSKVNYDEVPLITYAEPEPTALEPINYDSAATQNEAPLDYAPIEITREAYYPTEPQTDPNYVASSAQNVYYNEAYYPDYYHAGADQEYEPVTKEITVQDDSISGDGPKFKSKTIRFYPFR